MTKKQLIKRYNSWWLKTNESLEDLERVFGLIGSEVGNGTFDERVFRLADIITNLKF